MDAILQSQVEHSYDLFLGLVSDSRNISTARLRSDIAAGRTWAGGPARQVGLIDRFGNMDEALAYAAQKAGLSAGEWHAEYIEDEPDAFTAFFEAMAAPEESTDDGDMVSVLMARRDMAAGRSLADITALLDRPRMQARCFACPSMPTAQAAGDEKPLSRLILSRLGL